MIRQILTTAAYPVRTHIGMLVFVVLGSSTWLSRGSADDAAVRPETVRDRLWVFCCVAGSDDNYLQEANPPRTSRMTPAECAFYLDVPNLMMIQWQGKPAPPFDQYAIPFRPLKQTVWSLVGSGGETASAERKAVLDFAERCPNLTGFIMDDFFREDGSGQLTVEQLAELRKQLVINGASRDLHVVLYRHQLELPVQPYLDLCDKINYWTWHAEHLASLEEDFIRLEKLARGKPILLGCYFFDYPTRSPVPLELMQKQCRLGLRLLEEGRIDGIIFLANTVADHDFPSVEWTREWIAEIGDRRLITTAPSGQPPAAAARPAALHDSSSEIPHPN